jgi:hypothetical protein
VCVCVCVCVRLHVKRPQPELKATQTEPDAKHGLEEAGQRALIAPRECGGVVKRGPRHVEVGAHACRKAQADRLATREWWNEAVG